MFPVLCFNQKFTEGMPMTNLHNLTQFEGFWQLLALYAAALVLAFVFANQNKNRKS